MAKREKFEIRSEMELRVWRNNFTDIEREIVAHRVAIRESINDLCDVFIFNKIYSHLMSNNSCPQYISKYYSPEWMAIVKNIPCSDCLRAA